MSEREQFEAWFRKEHGWYEETLALSTGEFNAWQASRNAALEEAAVVAWSEGMDTYGPFSQLMDPRSVGSLCAKRIRAIANKKEG